MPTQRRHLGDQGEQLARQFLEARHYTILEANYRCRWGEVDLVAQDGAELVFVEVRTRHSRNFGTPEESITGAKARRLIATAYHYLQNHALTNASWRIDLIAVRAGPDYQPHQVNHVPHAVEL